MPFILQRHQKQCLSFVNNDIKNCVFNQTTELCHKSIVLWQKMDRLSYASATIINPHHIALHVHYCFFWKKVVIMSLCTGSTAVRINKLQHVFVPLQSLNLCNSNDIYKIVRPIQYMLILIIQCLAFKCNFVC